MKLPYRNNRFFCSKVSSKYESFYSNEQKLAKCYSIHTAWVFSEIRAYYIPILDDIQTIHALPFEWGTSANVWSCWVLPLLYKLGFQFCYTLIYVNFPGLSRSLPNTATPPPSPGFRMICFYWGRGGGEDLRQSPDVSSPEVGIYA